VATRVERGDWQTPDVLAREVVDALARAAYASTAPAAVLEPTCGRGAFLDAAAQQWPRASLVGFDIDARYVDAAAARLPRSRTRVHVADFFALDWRAELARLEGPLLVLGNPPWVTNAALGALGSSNVPVKDNRRGLTGLDARTGKSNFDVSEWMIATLLGALEGRDAILALLCKTAVARRLIAHIEAHALAVEPLGLDRIDAARHFDASVDAVLFRCRTSARARLRSRRWPLYASLQASAPEGEIAVMGGALVADAARYEATAHLEGECHPVWRSGLKHDCAAVMELTRAGGALRNGLGEIVDVEDAFVLPLLKSSDVANGRSATRAVLVTQEGLGAETESLAERAPRLFAYLTRHAEALGARRSSIYRGQPPFAMFGVGPYTFAPWKVAVSALYKAARFTLVGPEAGKPVAFDDTCYFLPFTDREDAVRVAEALASPLARDFFAARTFPDAKRPLTKAVLQKLDVARLVAAVAAAR